MMIVLQLVLYCLLYFLLVKAAAGNDGLRCLYFYPKEYQEVAFRRGLAEKETVARQSKRFMIPFCLVMLAALAAILTFWNRAADFKTALWQAALFLVVMNWFDGIVIDRLWVGCSPVWRIRGMEGIPYVKPWKTVLTRRALGTVVYLILAPAVAGLALTKRGESRTHIIAQSQFAAAKMDAVSGKQQRYLRFAELLLDRGRCGAHAHSRKIDAAEGSARGQQGAIRDLTRFSRTAGQQSKDTYEAENNRTFHPDIMFSEIAFALHGIFLKSQFGSAMHRSGIELTSARRLAYNKNSKQITIGMFLAVRPNCRAR